MSAGEKASPRPWALDPAGSGAIIQPLYANGEYSGGVILYPRPNRKGWFIDEATAEANAALIVKAVNAHDDLVALAGSYGPEVSMLNEEIEALTAERDALKAENAKLMSSLRIIQKMWRDAPLVYASNHAAGRAMFEEARSATEDRP